MERVLRDEEAARALRRQGIARSQRFTWERTAAATWQVLDEVAS